MLRSLRQLHSIASHSDTAQPHTSGAGQSPDIASVPHRTLNQTGLYKGIHLGAQATSRPRAMHYADMLNYARPLDPLKLLVTLCALYRSEHHSFREKLNALESR
jgi:hypothetical protein